MKNVKRMATTAAALGLAAASLAGFGAGAAHADPAGAVLAPAAAHPLTLEPGDYLGDDIRTSHGVGVYSSPNASSSKSITLWAPDVVNVGCWVSGGQVYNDGDVWYKIDAWSTQDEQGWNPISGWVFAPYVDGADYFHTNMVGNCNDY
ncbi:hypothetical protein [Streptacidiphilus cavernicola]|uniref:SH3 domain-containing protein n=1 Tax=Streptacidiphilus cavernicola TaxID=3342716 RepID=A0ABV6VUQ2_9ACTN